MKTLMYKLSGAIFLLAFNAAIAQKTVKTPWNWTQDSSTQKLNELYKRHFQERYFEMPKQGTAPADVAGAKEMSSEEPGTCSNYCPISKDGSLLCELTAEDHCPMKGSWHYHINQPSTIELKESTVDELLFSIVK